MLCCTFVCFPNKAFSALLSITGGKVENSVFQVQLEVKDATNLAGCKIVLSYDDTSLAFSGEQKSAPAASFLHVVNSSKPGRLVIVMAGAKNWGQENAPLITLQFTIQTIPKNITNKISIDTAQLMSDDLKPLPVTLENLKEQHK